MKSTLVIAFALISSLSFAQSTQQGKVLCYQGADPKTPLSNVSIAANNAPAVLSDAEGAFTLSFRTLHPGDAIQFRRVELNGYEVMNTEALEVARIMRKDSDHDLTIVLAKRETLQKLRAGYKSVASQRYEKQFKATEEQLEQMRKEGKIAEEQYNARLDSLEADYEDKLSKLETYIDKFARIDLSDLDADEQKIIALVQAGDFEGALKIYESQNLPERIKKSREDQAKLVAARDQIAEAASQTERENERLRASIERQVTLLFMTGGEENLKKVLDIYRNVFLADPTHSKARRDYAEQLNQLGNTQEAIRLIEEGIAMTKDPYTQGEMEIQIIRLYGYLDDLEQQYIHCTRADSLLWPLRESRYKVGTRALPIITDCYIKTLPFLGKANELPSLIERQKNYWNPDEQDQVSVVNYKDLLDVMSNYDSENERHEQSLWDAKESLRLNNLLGQFGFYNLYESYSNACSIFCFEGLLTEASESSRKSIECICSSYPRSKSTIDVIQMLNATIQCIESLIAAEYIDAADSLVNTINELGLYSTVEKRYPDVYVSLRGFYLLYIANIHAANSRVDIAEPLIKQALELIASDEDYAPVLPFLRASSMAALANAKKNYIEATSLYQEAIKAVLESCENQPSGWDKDNICHYYLGMADICNQQGEIKQARKWLKEAKKYAAFELDRQLITKRENKLK